MEHRSEEISSDHRLLATISPDAVECVHGAFRCFTHQDCDACCGAIFRETVYGLQGEGYDVLYGWPTPRTLGIIPPPDHIEETAQALRSKLAANGLPLFSVETMSERSTF